MTKKNRVLASAALATSIVDVLRTHGPLVTSRIVALVGMRVGRTEWQMRGLRRRGVIRQWMPGWDVNNCEKWWQLSEVDVDA